MLDHDVDLQPTHVRDLTDREAVRALFARLGYAVERGRETYPNAEGMSEKLAEAVKHIELIARDELGLLDVYLMELSSVTVARINDLAAHYRNRTGDYLTVLTTDYQRLDFVLFERQIPERSGGPTPAVRVIPRRLSVDRLHDATNRVVLRVLRRLSWTQADALAQADKLRSAFSIGEWSEESFDNRGLFADYYLKERLPDRPEWKAEGLKDAIREIGGVILEARERFREADEATVRAELLEPVFTRLGFDPKPAKGARGGLDYELSDPETGRKLAVCAAYQWDRFLDGPDPKDQATPDENPGATVLTLLEQEGNDWAVVTNGKHWRLYTRKTESRATNFLQVDAEEAAADTDPDAFRYFWLLFRAAAFRPREVVAEGETRSINLLEELLDGSRDYAKQVGDRLKERVFTGHSGERDEGIFSILAEGFIRDIRAREGQDADLSDERLELVHQSTLVLLYRLLFLLYAESRDLLPVREVGGFYEKSLTALKREIRDAGGMVEGQRDEHLKAAGYSALPAASGLSSAGKGAAAPCLYDRLLELFEIVAVGRPTVNMPPYNGGLFLPHLEDAIDERERATTEFLATHSLPDLCLARAIDRLARDVNSKTHGLAMIDFKSLGVRQLGSIYEGLLEFRVRIAPTTMAVCDQKGTEVILPHEEAVAATGVKIKRLGRGKNAPEHLLPSGTVYLENSKHERKATGSYYTPDYIVKYIVEHTVGPVLEEKLEALRPDLDRACKDFRKLAKAKREGGMAVPEAVLPAEKDLVARAFEMRVLDPAIGSGHFLVTSVDFIADRLIHFLNGFPGNPVERLLRETRRQILAEVAKQGIAIDEARLTDVNLLKRHVLKRCVYGVDLNPMAVELAKVSLWLHCFTLGAPLSFLDHHLKPGNSLIGEAGTAKPTLPGTSRWDEFVLAVGKYLTVSESADATAEQVLASRRQFRQAEAILEQARQELNVLTTRHFEKWKPSEVTELAIRDLSPASRARFARAQELAEQHRFFHWPLAFPEVWYGVREGTATVIEPKGEDKAGFDAVVGNPPYVRTQEVAGGSRGDREYLRARFAATAGGNYDVYVVFIERCLAPLSGRGRVGLIVPHKFLSTRYGEPLRKALADGRHLRQLVHFGEAQIFEGVTTYTCLLLLGRAPAEAFGFTAARDIATWQRQVPPPVMRPTSTRLDADGQQFLEGCGARLYGRLRSFPRTLADVCDRIFQGLKTGADPVFILEVGQDFHRSAALGEAVRLEPEFLCPLHKSGDFKRYYLAPSSRSIIFPYDHGQLVAWDEIEARAPLTAEYLLRCKALLDRRERGKWAGPKWYGYSRTQALESVFFPKILTADLNPAAAFCSDPDGHACFTGGAAGGYGIVTSALDPFYLLGLLNSKLLDWCLRQGSSTFRGGWFSYEARFIRALPVVVPDASNPSHRAECEKIRETSRAAVDLHRAIRSHGVVPRAHSAEFGTSMAKLGPLDGALQKTDRLIDQIVYRLYGLTEEEIAIVQEGAK